MGAFEGGEDQGNGDQPCQRFPARILWLEIVSIA
jgi:hypothetical protein